MPMPDQTQRHDEEQQQKQNQQQTGTQSANVTHDQEVARDATQDTSRALRPDELQRLARQDAASLEEHWPELNKEAEKALKQDFSEIADKADDARQAIDNFARQAKDADPQQIEQAKRAVDEEMRGARRDVNDAREQAQANGEMPQRVEQQMDRRFDKLADIEESFGKQASDFVAQSRKQSILENEKLDGSALKKELWEMSGHELEKSLLADFRKEAGLPDEALVFRDDDSQMVAANLSMKKVIDNINKLVQDEGVDAGNKALPDDPSRRAASTEQNERLRRHDDAGLEQRWPELNEKAENKLKDAFRQVREQADAARAAIDEAAAQPDANAQRLDSMRKLVDDEMRLARDDINKARESADAKQNVPADLMKRFDVREDRLERLERNLTEEEGSKVSDVLEKAGLAEIVDRHRATLRENVEFREEEASRAKANREVNPGGYDLARAELRAAKDELRELDNLLDRKAPAMRPDLVEARREERDGQERLRIDMTDFTHRVNSVAHTIKAQVYKEAMEKAFPDADVSMFEYRSPTMNQMMDDRKEFAERLAKEVEAREQEIERRRREGGGRD